MQSLRKKKKSQFLEKFVSVYDLKKFNKINTTRVYDIYLVYYISVNVFVVFFS